MQEQDPSSPEIAFQDADAARAKELPCPVCGESVGAAPTPCPRCDTPHHFDCWEYNEGCGVYGCTAKPRPRPKVEENTVDLPAKLGMPHKRTGTYAGVWWVPPVAAALAILCEFSAIWAFAAGSTAGGFGSLAAMVGCLLWIAFSSVHYYVDFEKMKITKAKAIGGRDLLEWTVHSLDKVEHLEVLQLADPFGVGGDSVGPQAYDERARRRYAVVAVFKGWRLPLEIAPPMRFTDPVMRDVADLFRRIEASGAFPVKMDHAVRTLPPPARNQLLIEASGGSKGSGTGEG